MAGSLLLERENVLENEWSRTITEEEREHDRRISENYQRLMNGQINASAAPAVEKPAVPDFSSAAKRIADYRPLKTAAYASSNVVDYAPPAVEPTYAPSPEEQRHELFERLFARESGAVDYAQPEAAATVAPTYAPAYAPSREPLIEPIYAPTEEDALPTPKTMETLNDVKREERQEESKKATGFFAALSTRTKVALAVVTVAIVLMIAVVCVNTAIINALNASISTRRADIQELTETAEDLQARIESLTDPEAIAEWAIEHGMELAE